MSAQQTFAEWVTVCKTCGSSDVTVSVDFTRNAVSQLPCGHPVNLLVIRNPKLPPLTERP